MDGSAVAEGLIEVREGARTERAARVLDAGALDLVARLHARLGAERRGLLASREARQREYDAGAVPDYLPASDVSGDWRVAALPADLLTRRVEITGPVADPKMVINMLSRTEGGDRADAAMLDFEDSMKPSWDNVVDGIENLTRAVDGTLSFSKTSRNGEPEEESRLATPVRHASGAQR